MSRRRSPEQRQQRKNRLEMMAGNNRPETEALNEDSTRAVMTVLLNQGLFPWIRGGEVETDRLGDDDWKLKTDAYIFVDENFCPFGLLDQYRIQIKSGWGDFSGLNANEIRKLLHLKYKKWQELGLVVLFGQATYESIAASFCLQIINYMEIAGVKNAREAFLSFQTAEVLMLLARFEAMDIDGRDWAKLLHWVATGRVKREERGGSSRVLFI